MIGVRPRLGFYLELGFHLVGVRGLAEARAFVLSDLLLLFLFIYRTYLISSDLLTVCLFKVEHE